MNYFRHLKNAIYSIKSTEYYKRTGKLDIKYLMTNFYISFLEIFFYSWWLPIIIFKENCVRTLKWFPIIWKDRHWDHWYILEILRCKIKFQREYIAKYGHSVSVKKDCRNMLIAEILIKRIQDDKYAEFYYKEHEEKWGKYDYKNWGHDDSILFDNCFSNRGLIRSKINSQEDWDKERKDSHKCKIRSIYMKKQDYDYLFKHLSKYLEHWWD